MKEDYLKNQKDTENFVEGVKQQLSKMSEVDKDQWILNQATILFPSQRQSFIETLKNNKVIMNMPSNDEFKEFCDDVRSGKRYIEYNTWYEEFDDYGYYHDDWEEQFYDTYNVIKFVDNIFEVCKNLNKLGYYDLICEYMESLNSLEIEIRETRDSEDSYEGTYPFTINVAYEHFLPYHKKDSVAYNWIYAFCHKETLLSIEEKANELLKLFLKPLCDKVVPSDFDCINSQLKEFMVIMLIEQIKNDELVYKKKYKCNEFLSNESYYFKENLDRKKELLANLKNI